MQKLGRTAKACCPARKTDADCNIISKHYGCRTKHTNFTLIYTKITLYYI